MDVLNQSEVRIVFVNPVRVVSPPAEGELPEEEARKQGELGKRTGVVGPFWHLGLRFQQSPSHPEPVAI